MEEVRYTYFGENYTHFKLVSGDGRCFSHSILHNVGLRRFAIVLHGVGAGAVSSLRLPDDLEEDLSST